MKEVTFRISVNEAGDFVYTLSDEPIGETPMGACRFVGGVLDGKKLFMPLAEEIHTFDFINDKENCRLSIYVKHPVIPSRYDLEDVI